MGRDNAVNVETTRKQIYHRSTREYIYRSLYYIMPVKPITGLRNDTKTCFDPLIQSILSLTPGQINCNGWSRKMKESLRHITDTNRVIALSELFLGNKDCPALAIYFLDDNETVLLPEMVGLRIILGYT